MVKVKKAKKSWKERLRSRQIRIQKALEAHRHRLEKTSGKLSKRPLWGRMILALCLIAITVSLFVAWYYPSSQLSSEQLLSPSSPQPVFNLNVVYIWPDGRIEPETAAIIQSESNYFIFTGNISMPVIVLKDNIVIDGAGYTLKGSMERGSRGIDLTQRKNVTIRNLRIQGFERGIYLSSSLYITIVQNELRENYCGIWLEFSSFNNITSNCIVKNEGYGVWLKNSTDNMLSGNTLTNHGNYTIYIGYSSGNMVVANNFTSNRLNLFLYFSLNNTIRCNSLSSNFQAIHLLYSSNNTIFENTIGNNMIGITFALSSGNLIYCNNFVNNIIQVESENSTNIWDNGPAIGGNYWSGYKDRYPNALELNGSGIWDTPYIINEDNKDRYPRVNPVNI